MNRLLTAAGILLAVVLVWSGCPAPPEQDSGGSLLPEQAAYDVTFYDLVLDVDPNEQVIRGRLTAHAEVLDPIEEFVLDLDRRQLWIELLQQSWHKSERVFRSYIRKVERFEHNSSKQLGL